MGTFQPTQLIGPVLSGILGLVGANTANKEAQANKTNDANSARTFDAQALQTALDALKAYTAGNPSPVAGMTVAGPTSVYGLPPGGSAQPTIPGAAAPPPRVQAPTQVRGNGGQLMSILGGYNPVQKFPETA